MRQIDDNKFSFSTRTHNDELTALLTALNATKAGVVITDCLQPDYPIVYCNKAFETLSGYSRNEVIGHNCRFLQGNDDNQDQRTRIREALSAGRNCTLEIRNYKKDGTLFWNELHLSPIKDKKGKVVHYVGVQNDVTRQKLADQQLRIEKLKVEKQLAEQQSSLTEDENFLTKLMETLNDSVLILAENLTVTKVNTAFLNTFHIAEDEILHRNFFEVDNGRWDVMGLRSLMDHLTTKKKNIQNYLIEDVPTRIGNKILRFSANFYKHQGRYSLILTINDITELREVERRKDDFLSVASHELKTPLTTITASLQLVQRMLHPETDIRLKETLNKTKTYVDRLENLITDLLDASRIKTGEIELTRQAFDLDAMIKHVADTLKKTYPEYTLSINGFASNYYLGDQLRLEQVLLHLLKNAIKFSPKGSTIHIYLSRLSDFIKVAITDYGLGVDFQYQKKIFETFYRVDDIQKQYPGIGIGLYVSNQIIKKHGGTLWVESSIGEGATFSFTLPLKRNNHDKENYDM
ncbi:hypothetical protein GCM10023231_18870 [Olivibacter ginsenosidimutans]|uniref:histidine kinase n=1 Tax=Olivibacter ginsenosidimutans TaxID=1176537 RepID=A0ABP9B617_9SPHI